MNKKNKTTHVAFAITVCLLAVAAVSAQESEPLTLRAAVARALQNSPDLVLARLHATVAEKATGVSRSVFQPNLYTGSGAAYSSGFPLGAPSVFNVSYVQTVFNSPLRGELRAARERAEGQRLALESARDAVIVGTASAYLELVKARHALELMRREKESAGKILEVTHHRAQEGFELPIEVTRAELAAARIGQGIVQLEGRAEALESELRRATGISPGEKLNVAAEEIPVAPEQQVEELVQQALAHNSDLKAAEAERRAREQLLKGERGGYWPTLDVVGQYAVFSRFNNYDEFYNRFERHNVTLGVQVRFPIFSARTSAAVSLAQSELAAADTQLRNRRVEIESEVRRQARQVREQEAGREVARLELKLAQENLAILQARLEEGRVNLREVEKARLEEMEKWRQFLDADYLRQRARLDLLRTTGQLARVFP